MNRRSASQQSRRGFSLLELIVVLVIAAALFAVVAASLASSVQAVAITSAADLIQAVFSEARAEATARDLTIEVRIYEMAPTPGATPIYRALQLHSLQPDGTTPAEDKIQFLPPGVAIDATATHSTLIASNPKTATDASDPNLDANTRLFHFLPTSGTDLDSSQSWFLTVRAAVLSDPAHFPTNWACVRVEPVNGLALIYRP